MKNIILLFLTFFLNLNSYSQCDNSTDKIMIFGDSWAFFSWQDDSYNENLDRYGLTDIRAKSNAEISVNGTRASNILMILGDEMQLNYFYCKTMILNMYILV